MAEERQGYIEANRARFRDYAERIEAARWLVFRFPVRRLGPSAILKGFLDRVMVPGIAFRMRDDSALGPRTCRTRRLGRDLWAAAHGFPAVRRPVAAHELVRRPRGENFILGALRAAETAGTVRDQVHRQGAPDCPVTKRGCGAPRKQRRPWLVAQERGLVRRTHDLVVRLGHDVTTIFQGAGAATTTGQLLAGSS